MRAECARSGTGVQMSVLCRVAKMAKLYGDRWRTVGNLGQGGQSVVYRVVDSRAEYEGEYALKRVLSSLRNDRFVTEVRAGLMLSHPNIVSIVDHSLLAEDEDKKFIVSPIAAGKDLSRRVGLYKGALDSTVVVARGLCEALAHAHSNLIIHRDVKPENVLFPSEDSHQPWLADFGICLYTDAASRVTGENEVVGSAYFMAPELEAGGVLDVTPAADVYSLGKVIYYMISGGRVMPREAVFNESNGFDWKEGGARYQLLRNLLGKMICPLSLRIKTMREVIAELDRIDSWEERVVGSPVSLIAKSAIASLKEEKLRTDQIRQRNLEARKSEIAKVDAVARQFVDWTKRQLDQARMELEDPDVLLVAVRDIGRPPGNVVVTLRDQQYVIVDGREIALTVPNVPFQTEYVLKFALCALTRLSPHADGHHEEPECDIQLIAYPFCGESWLGQPKPAYQQPKPVKSGFSVGEGRNTIAREVRFRASEWPAPVDRLLELLQEVLAATVAKVQRGTRFR